jgi:hypothetical protein
MLSKVTVWEHPEQKEGILSTDLSFNALKSRFLGVNSGVKFISVPRELHLVHMIHYYYLRGVMRARVPREETCCGRIFGL